jgi:hypothetical protein
MNEERADRTGQQGIARKALILAIILIATSRREYRNHFTDSKLIEKHKVM